MRQLCNAVDPDADLAALRSTADAAVRAGILLYAIIDLIYYHYFHSYGFA